MLRRTLPLLALCFFLAPDSAEAATKGIPLVDRLGATMGVAKLVLPRGSVTLSARLAPLPAVIDTGTEQFEARLYKAYLVSSVDPTIELPLGSVWPNVRGVAVVKAALKGDLSKLGFDRVAITAYSKDAQSSFDVLTATLPVQ